MTKVETWTMLADRLSAIAHDTRYTQTLRQAGDVIMDLAAEVDRLTARVAELEEEVKAERQQKNVNSARAAHYQNELEKLERDVGANLFGELLK